MSEIGTACETLRFTPLVAVFNSGAPYATKKSPNTNALQRVMQRSGDGTTIASRKSADFPGNDRFSGAVHGLFGTVVAILTSFLHLSAAESASLKAVGPDIAEALLATAFGLFAAIPAVVAYNQFVYKLRNIGGQMDDLQAEMLNFAEGDD